MQGPFDFLPLRLPTKAILTVSADLFKWFLILYKFESL